MEGKWGTKAVLKFLFYDIISIIMSLLNKRDFTIEKQLPFSIMKSSKWNPPSLLCN